MMILDARDLSLNFVGVLKDISRLDYGHFHTLIIIFRCEWIKQKYNRGNPTYVRDDVGFFTINFCHKLPLSYEPFIFPCQTTQVFFSDDIKKPGWKVVLRLEACSKKEVANIENVFITTTMEIDGLSVHEGLSPPPITTSLIRAIELSNKDSLKILTLTRF